MNQLTISRDGVANFFNRLFSIEPFKLILPTLMCIVLIAGAFSTVYGEKTETKLANESVNTVTELNIVFMEHQHFNKSINSSIEERQENISSKFEGLESDIKRDTLFDERRILSNLVIKTPLFPLTPRVERPPFQDRTLVEAQALIRYRGSELEKLDEKANSSVGYSYTQFREDTQEIKESKFEEAEVQKFIENYNETESGSAYLTGASNVRIEELGSGTLQKIGLASFLPSLLFTFLLYLGLNSVLVETTRELRSKIN